MFVLLTTYVVVGQFQSDLQTIAIHGFMNNTLCLEAAVKIRDQLKFSDSIKVSDIKSNCLTLN